MGPKTRSDQRAQALAEAVKNHGGGLLSMIGGRIRDEIEAQDIAQDVFTEFLEAYDADQVFDSLRAWLMKVAQNKILDRFRKRKTESSYRETFTAENTTQPTSLDLPDDDLTRTWLRGQMADALAACPLEQREVFILHELEGKSFEEIAAITGRNTNTLLSQKRYAIQFLRDYLKEIYDEFE